MRLPPAPLIRGVLSLGLLSGFLFLSGCARPIGNVSGKVTYNGKPLKGGNVSFVNTEGRPSGSAEIKDDGTYQINNLTGGNYKVCVETASLKGPPQHGPPGGGMGSGKMGGTKTAGKTTIPKGGGPPPGANLPEGYTPSNPAEVATQRNAKKYIEIPDKYADPSKTDLTHTVVAGDQTKDIDLK